MSAPKHNRDGGTRMPYSKPRNRRRDKVISLERRRDLIWQVDFDYLTRRQVARVLDRARVRFMTHDRAMAVEMQRLRADVLG